MPYIILGIGVGCWMYSFINHRWNDHPWTNSSFFFWTGVMAVIVGFVLIFR